MKISVIIPVYNCEKYLEQCLKGACHQTIKDLEIICVDDGSTDRSKEIIQKFQMQDTRIHLHYQINQGAGAARNLGLKKANGTYIAFLDGDDYYKDENALELMYEICERKQVSICTSSKICLCSDEERLVEKFPQEYKEEILDYKDFQTDYYFQNCLFRRKLLIENNIFFPLYRRYQDPPFLVRAFWTAGIFSVADTCLYCYRVSDISKKFNGKKTEDLLTGVLDNLVFAEQNELDILFKNTAERIDHNFLRIIYENISPDRLSILRLLLEINEMICRHEQNPDYIVKPLKYILFHYQDYEKKILHVMEMQEEIALFGAGRYARTFIKFLAWNHMSHKIRYMIISEKSDHDEEVEGIPIISLKEFLDQKIDLDVILTVNTKNGKEIEEVLEAKGYKKYKKLDETFWEMLLLNGVIYG